MYCIKATFFKKKRQILHHITQLFILLSNTGLEPNTSRLMCQLTYRQDWDLIMDRFSIRKIEIAISNRYRKILLKHHRQFFMCCNLYKSLKI